MSTVDTSKLHPKCEDMIRIAVTLGWKAHNTAHGGVYIVSPVDPKITIQFPANGQLNDKVAKSWMSKIARYGDEQKVLMAQVSTGLVDELEKNPNFVREHSYMNVSFVGDPVIAGGDIPAEDDPEPVRKPRVVSETPWIARRRTNDERGRGYESGAVIERQWSDGSRDYACSWPGCDYTNALPVSVARHYGRSNDHVQPAKPGREQVIEKYEPKQRGDNKAARIRRLLAELDQAAGSLDPGYSLEDLASKVIERRDERRVHHEDEAGEPLTAEQMLDRIRLMIDDGTFAQRAEQMTKQQVEIESLSSEVHHLNERLAASERNALAAVEAANDIALERDAARAEADELRGDWLALTDIINKEKKS